MADHEQNAVKKIVVKKAESLRPDCPHCERELREVFYRELAGPTNRSFIYFCPNCKKVLGIAQN